MEKTEAALGTKSFEFGSVLYTKESSVGSKRRPEAAVLDGGPPEKRLKTVVDSSCLTRQCSTILKELMKHPTVDAANAEGFSTSNKARRAAMLKCRFADTICKAQKKMKALKADLMKMKHEKEQLEEKAKIEATEIKVNVELKKQRERDRKAARIALEKMGNTAGIEVNVEIQKEVEILSGCSLSRRNYPLHHLGLFLKHENLELVDIEEGEIVCLSSHLTSSSTMADSSKGLLHSETATKMKAKIKLEKQRERDRKAARIALEEMGNTAGIELNLEVQKEFEILIGCSSSTWESTASSRFYH